MQFSLFERRHVGLQIVFFTLPFSHVLSQHCRKCGGVFCSACSSRSTPLLDTSNLLFLHPPRNIPLTQFESPTSPIIDSRVCGDCWNQLHGCPSTPRSSIRSLSKRVLSSPISMFCSSPPSTTPNSLSPNIDSILPPSLKRRLHTLPDPPSSSSLSFQSSTSLTPLCASHPTHPPDLERPYGELDTYPLRRSSVLNASQPTHPPDLERSYGELDTYPLRRSSVVCKATGGGRWEPKQIPVLDGYRQPIPGGKAPYEIEMEREELLVRQRRENPVIKDGEFQYRFARVPEPLSIVRSPHYLSTF